MRRSGTETFTWQLTSYQLPPFPAKRVVLAFYCHFIGQRPQASVKRVEVEFFGTQNDSNKQPPALVY